MNPEMQTTLLNTDPPNLIATIMKAFREQLKESDQLHSVEEIAGPVPEIPLEYDQILKGGGKFWDDVNGGYLPEDLVLAARREEIDWVHSEGVYDNARVQRCGHETVGPNLGGHRQVCGSDTQENSIEVVCKRIQNEEARSDSTNSTSFSIVLWNATSRSGEGACLNHDVGEFVKQRKPLKLRHYDISRAHFQGTAQRLIYIKLPAEDRQKYGEDKVGRMIKSMYGTQDASHIWQLDYVNLMCGELGSFRRGKHSAALFHSPNQDVRMAVHGDDFECLSDDDGLKHNDSLLKSKYTARDMGTLGFEDSDVKSLLLSNRVFRVGVDQTGQYLDLELDLRHVPLSSWTATLLATRPLGRARRDW